MQLEHGIVHPGLNQEVVDDAAKPVMHRLIAQFIARDPLLIDRTQASLAELSKHFPHRSFIAHWEDLLRLVVAARDATTLPAELKASVPESRFLEIAADARDAASFAMTFGKGGAAVLVRPDGYAGLTTPISAAAGQVAAYLRKCFSASAADAHC